MGFPARHAKDEPLSNTIQVDIKCPKDTLRYLRHESLV